MSTARSPDGFLTYPVRLGCLELKVSSFSRSGPFDSYDEPSSWDSSISSDASWIRPPSFATIVLLFWIAVFGIAMFWHRGGHPTSPVADSAAELYPYGVNPYSTALPVYGYPEFDSAAVYKYFYNLYMKRLQEASSSVPTPRPLPRRATGSVPKPEAMKPEEHQASEEPVTHPANEDSASSQPIPSASPVPVERADIPNARFSQPLNSPLAPSPKAVSLPQANLPQRALPDLASSTPSAKSALKVAPVGLPGYERQPMVVPQGTVKSVYPKVEVVVQPSE